VTTWDYLIVSAIWIAYAAAASVCVWGVLRLTRGASPWMRRALVSLVLAAFFAPSVVGGGHGGGIGPAWLALFQMFPLKLGVLPIAVTFAVLFVGGSLLSLGTRDKQ
jgi:hypothetical protein